MGFFDHISTAPPDPIFGLVSAFNSDPRKSKVNLTVGYYRDEELKTPVMRSVKKAEILLAERALSKHYLPIEGDKALLELIAPTIFGNVFWVKEKSRIACFQGVGGTGALRIGANFLKCEVGEFAYISEPTWPNHRGVFSYAGMNVETYPYYDRVSQSLRFEKMVDFCSTLSPGSILVLHASCHNPTGADLSLNEWKILSDVCMEKRLVPFFDSAYQGFCKSFEEDVAPIRLFAERGHEMLVASSYSKNFSLYPERTGALFVVTSSEKIASAVVTKIKALIRATYSNPPQHGSCIIREIFSHPGLKNDWEIELSSMRERIQRMRNELAQSLMVKSKKKDFSFLLQRAGLFCFTGLSKEQVDRIIAEHGIYMTSDGRINVAGLNLNNLDYVVDAIVAVS
jgi:aspartate aminotransferase